ncbi:phosphotransferase family protein [Nonomuraea antimicrobica]
MEPRGAVSHPDARRPRLVEDHAGVRRRRRQRDGGARRGRPCDRADRGRRRPGQPPGPARSRAGRGLLERLTRCHPYDHHPFRRRPGGRHPPAGLPRRTPEGLAERVDEVIDRTDLTSEEREKARRLVHVLPALVAELNACGLPETVVHGDFHTGNWRSNGGTAVVLDFADAHVGHPVLDGLRTRMFMSEADWHLPITTWIDAWRKHAPGSNPARALELAEPYQHLFYAVRYQEFLDGIELSERVYHDGDPVGELRKALRAIRP